MSILDPWSSLRRSHPRSVEPRLFLAAYWALVITVFEFVLGELLAGAKLTLAPHTLFVGTNVWEPTINSAWLAAFVAFLLLPRRRWELPLVLVTGISLEAWLWLYKSSTRSLEDLVLGIGTALGVAATLAVIGRLLIGRERLFGYLCLMTFMPIGRAVGGWTAVFISLSNIQVYDLFGFALDARLGHPAYRIASWLLGVEPLRLASYTIYVELPLVMMLSFLLVLRFPRRVYFNPVLAAIVTGILGSYLYDVYPMAGYYWWQSNFPHGPIPPVPDPPTLIGITPLKARNCMPSLHATWIFLVFLSLRHMGPRIWWLGFVCTVGTLLSTLRVGHYFIDLIVAFPFTLTIVSLCAWGHRVGHRRLVVLPAALGMLGLCYLGLMTFWRVLVEQPSLLIGGSVGVVAASVLLERWLAHGFVAREEALEEETGSA